MLKYFKNKDKYISEYSNKLSKNDCQFIIEFIESFDLLPGKVNNGIVVKEWKDSSDKTMFLSSENNTINQLIFPKLIDCIEEYNKEHPELESIDPWRINNAYNAQRYLPGQFFKKLIVKQEVMEFVREF